MNPIDPVILFFLFGLAAGLLRSELKLPSALYESLSIFLLLTIGLKGGQGLATQPLAPLIPQIGAVIVLGVAQTLIAFAVLHCTAGDALIALAGVRAEVDRFFDDVMVNVDEPLVRANRLGLLKSLFEQLNAVADISRLAV